MTDHTHTPVPGDYFASMIVVLDAPVQRNEALTDAAKQRRRFTQATPETVAPWHDNHWADLNPIVDAPAAAAVEAVTP